MLTITTIHVPRDIVEAWELSADERKEFDYLPWKAIEEGRESAQFFRYRGELFDLGEFQVWDNPSSPTRKDWDGFRPDTYFSGLVIKYADNFERVIVGRYYYS